LSLIKNALLLPIQHLVGQTPTPTPAVVDDDHVSLVLPVVPDIARRSLSSQPTGGWFQGLLENNHVSDDAIISDILVYSPNEDAVAPYPAQVPENFDVWFIGAAVQRASGTGGIAEAQIGINAPPHSQGFGKDQAGASVVSSPPMSLGRWDALDSGATGARDENLITEAGQTYIPINMRLPRGTRIRFETLSTGAAAVEFRAMLIIGLFPSAMGQDIAT